MAQQFYVVNSTGNLENVQVVNTQDVSFTPQQVFLTPDKNTGNLQQMQVLFQQSDVQGQTTNTPAVVTTPAYPQRRWILTKEGTLESAYSSPPIMYTTNDQVQTVSPQIQQQPGISQPRLELTNPQTSMIISPIKTDPQQDGNIIIPNTVIHTGMQITPTQLQPQNHSQQIIIQQAPRPPQQQQQQQAIIEKRPVQYTFAPVAQGQNQIQIRGRIVNQMGNPRPGTVVFNSRPNPQIRMQTNQLRPIRMGIQMKPASITVRQRQPMPPKPRVPMIIQMKGPTQQSQQQQRPNLVPVRQNIIAQPQVVQSQPPLPPQQEPPQPPPQPMVEITKTIPSPSESDDIEKNLSAVILHRTQQSEQQGSQEQQQIIINTSNSQQLRPLTPSTAIFKRTISTSSGGTTIIANRTTPDGMSRVLLTPKMQQHQLMAQQRAKISQFTTPIKTEQKTVEFIEQQSAKMLVVLPNDEHRLITFTLPKESCTVQELLEQVGVPMTPNRNVKCESYTGSDIDYVVHVEDVCPQPGQTQFVMAGGTPQKPSEVVLRQRPSIVIQQRQQPVPALTAISAPKNEHQPKYVEGFLAVCHCCGYSGSDFARCERCLRVFTTEPKRQKIEHKPQQHQIQQNQTQMMGITKQIRVPLYKVTTVGGRGKVVTSTPMATVSRGRGRGRPKVEAIEPPVVVTLSSDEEDEEHHSNHRNKSNNSTPGNSLVKIPPNPPVAALNCEPKLQAFNDNTTIEDSERKDVCSDSTSPDYLYTAIECNGIRVGSYTFEVKGNPIIITSNGIKFLAPNSKNPTKLETINIQMAEIVKVIVHYGKNFPVLFVYATPNCAKYIRRTLDMSSIFIQNATPKCNFYDPINSLDYLKRIIFTLKTVRDDSKETIKSIFPLAKYDEISHKDALELFNRSKGPTNQQELMVKKTMVTRGVTAENQKQQSLQASQSNPEEIHKILIYPQGKGGISINTEDYLCLATDQYLNDVIIDFYLKYVYLEKMTEQQRQKTHIFSSFFYKRLTATSARQRLIEKDLKLTPSQKRHNRVKSWTKSVNLFEKDFIIIPINELSHWFLAVICFPGLKQPHTMADNKPTTVVSVQEKKQKAQLNKSENAPHQNNSLKKQISLTIGNTTITPVKKDDSSIYLNEDSLSERDEAEGDESDLSSEDEEAEPEPQAEQKELPIKQPTILIFDSLAGNFRSRVVATLRDYLTCEYGIKVKDQHSFNKDNMPGHNVKVPQQNNFTDCGLFLLQYVEEFFANPVKDFRLPIRSLMNWFDTDRVTKKREDIGNLLMEMVEKEHPERLELLPDIKFPTLNGVFLEPDEDENEEDEMEEEEDCFEEPEYELPVEEESDGTTKESQMEVDESAEENSAQDKSAVKRKKRISIPTSQVAKKAARIS